MKCLKCGIDLVEGTKFCPECGAAVEAPVEETPAVEETVVEAPVEETPAVEETVVKAPVEEKVAEAPVEDTPSEDTSVEETIAAETPKSAFATTETPSATEEPKSAFSVSAERTGSSDAPVETNVYDSAPVYNTVAPVDENFSKGLAIGSLVCGILSIITCCCCAGLGLILGIVGIVLGCLQKPDISGKKPTMAIVGIVLSGIGIASTLASMLLTLTPAYKEMMGNIAKSQSYY